MKFVGNWLTFFKLYVLLNWDNSKSLFSFLKRELTKNFKHFTYIINHKGVIWDFSLLVSWHELVFVPVVLVWLTFIIYYLLVHKNWFLLLYLVGFFYIVSGIFIQRPSQSFRCSQRILSLYHLMYICIHVSSIIILRYSLLINWFFNDMSRECIYAFLSQWFIECSEIVLCFAHFLSEHL